MGKGKPRHDAPQPIEVPPYDDGSGHHPWLAYDINISTDDGEGMRRVEIWTDAGEVVVYSNGAVEGP